MMMIEKIAGLPGTGYVAKAFKGVGKPAPQMKKWLAGAKKTRAKYPANPGMAKTALPLAKTSKVRMALAKILAKKKPKPKRYKTKMAKGGVAY